MTLYCDKCGARHDSSVCPSCSGFGKSPPMTAPDDVRARLLPCPFCGRSPEVRIPSERDGFAAHVTCRCGAQLYGQKRHFADEQEAIAAWNRRAAHADMSGEVRELVEVVRGVADDLREWGATDFQLAMRAARLDTALAKHTHQEKP